MPLPIDKGKNGKITKSRKSETIAGARGKVRERVPCAQAETHIRMWRGGGGLKHISGRSLTYKLGGTINKWRVWWGIPWTHRKKGGRRKNGDWRTGACLI